MNVASVFSSLDQQPYETMTSPQEQAASDTGNDQGPSGKATPDAAPLTKIMSALMRGAAKVQGQEQAKAIVSKQAAANARMSITMKPGEPGEPPFVTVKDAPADLLNGTQAADVKEAYTRPARQVEAKIASAQAPQQAPQQAAPTAQAPTNPPPADHPLEQAASLVDQNLGYRTPRPWDPDIAEKLKSEDGIRQIAEEMGAPDPKADAHQAWRQIQHGKVSVQAVQQRVANFRLQKLEEAANRIEQTMAPADRAAAARQAEADRQANMARLARTQTDAETKAANDEKLGWLRATDLSTIDPDKLEETARTSTNAAWTASDINRAKLKQQQDVNKAFLDYTDTKKDTFALGNQPSWEAAKAAFGHPLTAQQDTIGKARWQAARAYTLRKAEDEDLKRQHADDQHELAMLRVQNASKEKPTALARSDINLMDAGELTAMDPATVKNYDGALEAKEGLLKKEIADHTDKRAKAGAQAKAILTKKQRQFGDEEQLAGYQADQKSANDRLEAAKAQLKQIQAARAARRTGGTVQPVTPAARVTPPPAAPPPAARPVQPPNVPHRPVANGQYTPEVEAGIAKAMADHHIGRQQVIRQLKASGFLQ